MNTIFSIVVELSCSNLVSGKTVNATFLQRKCSQTRPKAKIRGIKLLIDNASSQTAKLTKVFLEAEGLDLLPHPPYSPDLAPCDFPQAQNLPSSQGICLETNPRDGPVPVLQNHSRRRVQECVYKMGGSIKKVCSSRRRLLRVNNKLNRIL